MDWTFLPEPDIPPDLLAWTGNRLLARLLVQRGLTTVEAARAFINPDDYEPASPADLPDMTIAVDHLNRAIDQQMPICVWGDFDVDGQTATTLLVSVLRQLGAEVDYYIPHRLTEGHGLKLDKLRQILQSGAGLILTCDTGIEAHEAVEATHAAGAEIIITDHHDLGETLPPAEAVINPKRLPNDHPLRELPGVGVAYKLAEALTQARRQADLAEALLDLVALGIVADVAVQRGDTRYLLQRGQAVLRRTERPGLVTLIKIANLEQSQLTAEHIGFWLGPRLNALGRLGDANQAVELLTTGDTGRARILAAQLDALNERRKLLVDRTVVQALSQLADTPSLGEYNALVLAAAEWHPGVIGIAASRLVEQFARPVILLTEREGLLRGSARSLAGCDIHQAIKTQAELLESFGGHPMAAGLSLHPRHLSDFRRGLSEALQDCVAGMERSLTIDTTATLPELNLDLLHTLQKLDPFGPGNPPVKFAVTGLTLQEEALIGRAREHRRLVVADQGGHTAEVVWWNGADEALPSGAFDLALTLSRDNYRQQEAVQLVWLEAREQASEEEPVKRRVIDLRAETDPLALLDDPEALFFGVEAPPKGKRFTPDVAPAEKLVIWQAPPGQDILAQLLATTQPEVIYMVARPGPYDTLPTFIKQLMGLIKYSLSHYGGRLEIETLALAMGHRPATIRLGLQWLAGQGKLRVIAPLGSADPIQTEDILVVRANQEPATAQIDGLTEMLLDLLHETAAYRNFVRQANLSALGLGD